MRPGALTGVTLRLSAVLLALLALWQVFFRPTTAVEVRGTLRNSQGVPVSDVPLVAYVFFSRGAHAEVLRVDPSGTLQVEWDARRPAPEDGQPTEPVSRQLQWQADGSFHLLLEGRWSRSPRALRLLFRPADQPELLTAELKLLPAPESEPLHCVLQGDALGLTLPEPSAGPDAPPVPPPLPSHARHTLPGRLTTIQFSELIDELGEGSGAVPGPVPDDRSVTLHCEQDQVYLGVGTEDNLTFIAEARPRLAFLFVENREELLRVFILKAALSLAPTPAEYRRLLTAGGPPHEDLFQQNREEILELVGGYGVLLSPNDHLRLERQLREYFYGRRPLAIEVGAEDYAALRRLAEDNRLIPLVAGLDGSRALPALADTLRAEGAEVSLVYLGAAERALTPDGQLDDRFEAWLENLRALPLSPRCLLLRTSFDGTRTVSTPAQRFLARVEQNRYRTYQDLATP